jgi:hypothetical protein
VAVAGGKVAVGYPQPQVGTGGGIFNQLNGHSFLSFFAKILYNIIAK